MNNHDCLRNLQSQIAVSASLGDNTQLFHGVGDSSRIPEILEVGELRASEFVNKVNINEIDKILMDLKRYGNANWGEAESIIQENKEYFRKEGSETTWDIFKSGEITKLLNKNAERVEIRGEMKNIHTVDSRSVCVYLTEYEDEARSYAGENSGYFEFIIPDGAIGNQRPSYIQIPGAVPLEYSTVLHISEEFMETPEQERICDLEELCSNYPGMDLEVY